MTTARRDFLKSAGGAAALTTSIFTGKVKGANDRVAVGFIGMGAMGTGNLGFAMKNPRSRRWRCAMSTSRIWSGRRPHARKAGLHPKAVKDFREIHRGQIDRRGLHRHAGPLARLYGGGGVQSRQGRVRGEAGQHVR